MPAPPDLIGRIAELPHGGPLLERLRHQPGVYLVGGAVRDLLLGGHPTDLDLVVDGDPAAVAAALGGARVVHDRFGTSTVSTADHSYDVARARRETYARPGALPDVAPAPLAQDLLRRDFTVNAIAVALGGERPGEITAAPRALEDLEARQLRVLHPRSFLDDPTRLLRLARYVSRLGFGAEPDTRSLAARAVAGRALETVSGPRVGNELRLLLREPDPVAALQALSDLGLDRAIHPQFGIPDLNLARRALGLLPEDGRPERLLLAAACLQVPEPQELLDRLAFEAPDRDAVISAATRYHGLAQALAAVGRPSEIARAVGTLPLEAVALAGASGPQEPARQWLAQLRRVRPDVDGSDLLAAGLPQGPQIGRALAAALEAKLDGRAAGREEQLAVALEAVGHTG